MSTAVATTATLGHWRDYLALGKPRLSGLVIFSALLGYGVGAATFSWVSLIALALGGWLVTVGANAWNQIMEVAHDARMRRTQNRPLPTGRLQRSHAVIFALVVSLTGTGLLALLLNPLTGALALVSTLLYVVAYTPLKRISPIAVLVGAVPGGLPPLIGWAAATGTLGPPAWALFGVQFAWQLPHFWAIAWLAFDDYDNAGYRLMLTPGGANVANAGWTFLVALLVIPAGLLPNLAGIAGAGATVLLVVLGVAFALPAANHWQRPSRRGALEVMYASFVYLPLSQLILFTDRFIP